MTKELEAVHPYTATWIIASKSYKSGCTHNQGWYPIITDADKRTSRTMSVLVNQHPWCLCCLINLMQSSRATIQLINTTYICSVAYGLYFSSAILRSSTIVSNCLLFSEQKPKPHCRSLRLSDIWSNILFKSFGIINQQWQSSGLHIRTACRK